MSDISDRQRRSSLLVRAGSVALLAVLAACQAQRRPGAENEVSASDEAPAPAGTIVLGDISTDVVSKIARWQPLSDYLAARLHAHGIGVGRVKVAQDQDTMIRWLESGEVDLYVDSFYPATSVMERSTARVALLRRFHDAQYGSVLVVRPDSVVRSTADLGGLVIALEKPGSTSGFMLPMAHLLQTGLNPVERSGPDGKVAKGEVGYIFTEDDSNSIHWVLSGKVAAGAVDTREFEDFSQTNPEALKVLDVSATMMQDHLVLARPGLDAPLLSEIKSLLTGLDETADAQAILEPLKTAGFFEVAPAEEERLARGRELFDLVEGYLRRKEPSQ